MEQATVFCQFELERFPASAFYRDAEGRYVHRTHPLHTVDGFLLGEHNVPLPPVLPAAPPAIAPDADARG